MEYDFRFFWFLKQTLYKNKHQCTEKHKYDCQVAPVGIINILPAVDQADLIN